MTWVNKSPNRPSNYPPTHAHINTTDYAFKCEEEKEGEM